MVQTTLYDDIHWSGLVRAGLLRCEICGVVIDCGCFSVYSEYYDRWLEVCDDCDLVIPWWRIKKCKIETTKQWLSKRKGARA